MISTWRAVTMRDVIDEFYDGPHATPSPSTDGPVYLGIKNLTEDGHLDMTEVRYIAESDYPKWTRRVEPRKGDLVFTYEASLHRYAVIPEGFRGALGRRVALLRTRSDIIDTRFLLYVFIGPEWRATVQKRLNVGSTVDRLPLTDFPSFPLRIPSLDEQLKIAAILSAYDDLIENNNRRIELLEEMAQRIYREWFVDFRYPGHDVVPMVDSEFGRIPQGWCFRPLSTLAKVVMGQSPPSSAYNKNREGKPFHQGVGTFGTHFPAHDVYSKTGTRLAEKDDILMSVRAPVGRINVADREMILGRGLSGIRAEAGPFEFLLFALRHFFREEDVMGNGSIFKSVTKRDVENLPLPWPGHNTAQRFSDLVSPMWRHLQLLTRERLNLESTRDLLLPRLVSGDVDVTNLNIDITETAA